MSGWAAAFGMARALTIDPSALGDHPATVVIQVPDLSGFRNIPLLQKKWVSVTVSTHSACSSDPTQPPKLTELGEGVLTVKQHEQLVKLPGNTDLAVFAESTEQAAGSSAMCTAALRFHSEPDKQYRIQYRSPQHFNRGGCAIAITEIDGGKEAPVSSAHVARSTPVGFIKGGDLNVCAEGSAPLDAPGSAGASHDIAEAKDSTQKAAGSAIGSSSPIESSGGDNQAGNDKSSDYN